MDDSTKPATEESGTITKDLILDLNFVPDWARKAPEANYFDSNRGSHTERPERRRDFGDRRSDSRSRDRGPRPERRREEGPRNTDRRRSQDREPFERIERPQVCIRFLPHRNYLTEVIRRIKLSKRAHPLLQVAELFIANPGSCEVRIEVDYEAKNVNIYQCKVCGMVAMREDTLFSHITQTHLENFFTKEEKEGPEPKGKFNCILQCGLTNQLIGPPNHHSTADKIKEIRTTHYKGMSEDEYKSHLRTFHDAEKIEQWKQLSRKETSYRLKTAAEGDKAMNWAGAETFFKTSIAPSQCVKSKKVSLSGKIARDIQDPGLAMAVRDAWQQESRFPASLVGSLRGAFRSMDLQHFKAGRGAIFISDIKPCPIDPETAIPSIRDVLLYLKDHPGCTRATLVEVLRPGSAIDSAEAKEILSPLTWLIERGHIIEFFDGTLAVIHGKPARK